MLAYFVWYLIFSFLFNQYLAGLFYERYPNLFDPSEVEFKVGITSKVRTNETAHAFVDGLSDLRPGINAFAKIKYR